MPGMYAQGATVTRDAFYRNAQGLVVTPDNPLVDVIDATGTTVVNNAVPTELSTGHYEYAYPLAGDAPLGAWEYHWTGTIDGSPVSADDGWTVVPAGEVVIPPGGPQYGPCADWCAWTDVTRACPDVPDTAVDVQALILATVSELMWKLSCSQFGVCTITARVCPTCRHGWNAGGWPWTGYYRPPRCGCGAYEYVELGDAPIVTVDAVVIDGAVLDPASYRVDDWARLVRTDGDIWPRCQALNLEDGAPGTFSVTWTYGVPIPTGGVTAAALLACNVAKGLAGGDCAVPPGTTSVSREGVTVNIVDTEEAVATGKTGVILTDLWLETVCPGGFAKQGGAFQPGRRRNYVRTNT